MSSLKLKTFQYTTSERDRAIDHNQNSHGMPGIYFKYDIDAICVKVVDDTIPLWKFLIRLCGIIGGIFATSGILNTLLNAIVDVITCKYIQRISINSQHNIDTSGFQTVQDFSVPSDNISLLYSAQQNGKH
jgi:hypothetical protein